MSSRQQQQSGNQQSRSNSQTYQKNFNQTNPPQGPPPPYPSPNATKRFKTDTGDPKPVANQQPQQTPSFYLTAQQLQLLNYFQQNSANLTPPQQVGAFFGHV